MLHDEEILTLLRQAYTAVQELAKSDETVADHAGVVFALDAIRQAGTITRDFLSRFRDDQAAQFGEGLPGYDEAK